MAIRLDAAPRESYGLTDWNAVPVFGEPHPSWPTKVRPSAYGVVQDARRQIAIVETPEGYSLPGGGSDVNESPEQTVIRETSEECSLVVQVGSWRVAAIEHVASLKERTSFEKRGIFCDAVPVGRAAAQQELDHRLRWATPTEAKALLTHAIHRWALEQWLSAGQSLSGGTSWVIEDPIVIEYLQRSDRSRDSTP